jgi:hypothetical protein
MLGRDVLGFGAAALFGIWWVLLPESVLRFYRWFHRGKAKLPGPGGVRLSGAVWLLVVAAVFWRARG